MLGREFPKRAWVLAFHRSALGPRIRYLKDIRNAFSEMAIEKVEPPCLIPQVFLPGAAIPVVMRRPRHMSLPATRLGGLLWMTLPHMSVDVIVSELHASARLRASEGAQH